MAIESGSRLGPYQILSRLGAGGMGEVYRGHDTRLNRDVALKVLPQSLAADPERLSRFRREAQLLAALNHPNIAAVHGLEESGTTCALVMELVEGENLAQRLATGPLPIEDIQVLALQLAEALEAAHEKGIVHRDLKPANIQVTPEGVIKVLDFGLAKAVEGGSLDGREGAGAELSQSPTLSLATTQAGVILGTAAYMSPEQARGKTVDKRTDIWAFGAILFEMLSGTPLCSGETVTDVLAAVVTGDRPWDRLPAHTPEVWRRLLHRCLEQDPKMRLRDVGEARIALLTKPEAEPPMAPSRTKKRYRPRAAPWLLASGLALALAWMALTRPPRGSGSLEVVHSEIRFEPGDEPFPYGAPHAISPDGTQIAYIAIQKGPRRVKLRKLSSRESIVLPKGDGANSIRFSPDGRSLAILGLDRAIRSVSLEDGSVSTLVSRSDPADFVWDDPAQVVFTLDRELWRVSGAGATPVRLTQLERQQNEVLHIAAENLPGDDNLLFTIWRQNFESSAIGVVSLTTGRRVLLLEDAAEPLFLPPHYLIFRRGDRVLAVNFDLQTLQVTLPGRVVMEPGVMFPTALQGRFASLSATGTLLYAPASGALSELVLVSRDGRESPLGGSGSGYANPRLSPDERRLIVSKASLGLWLFDLARGSETLVAKRADLAFPVWVPGSDEVILYQPSQLWRVPVDGSGPGSVLAETSNVDLPSGVTPDGKTLAFTRLTDQGGDIFVLPVGEGRAQPLIQTPAYESGAQFSPDGRWIIYSSDESDSLQVYLRPYPGPGRKWQVSAGGGTQARWSPTGQEIFYRLGNKMIAVAVNLSGSEPRLSTPVVLFEQPYIYGLNVTVPNYDVLRDGRFLMIKPGASPHLALVQNWAEDVKARFHTSADAKERP